MLRWSWVRAPHWAHFSLLGYFKTLIQSIECGNRFIEIICVNELKLNFKCFKANYDILIILCDLVAQLVVSPWLAEIHGFESWLSLIFSIKETQIYIHKLRIIIIGRLKVWIYKKQKSKVR